MATPNELKAPRVAVLLHTEHLGGNTAEYRIVSLHADIAGANMAMRAAAQLKLTQLRKEWDLAVADATQAHCVEALLRWGLRADDAKAELIDYLPTTSAEAVVRLDDHGERCVAVAFEKGFERAASCDGNDDEDGAKIRSYTYVVIVLPGD